MSDVERYRSVQHIARAVLSALGPTIGPDDTERTIAARATDLLARHGINETWYHACPAFVLLGSRSCLSISGRDYQPADEPVGQHNVVTVDLSPMRDGIWGDCARSFCIEQGRYASTPVTPAFVRGLDAERYLHGQMVAFVRPHTTFDALFTFANDRIHGLGLENLDFMGNVGHSIELEGGTRSYIVSGNHEVLADARFFTFEPHVRAVGSAWGFKHENIYYFDADGRCQIL
ncbi:MAG: M24 family metallopeptidase [Pseudomonas sp.]|uniref:M24 family metallopeptidase n=1 Tax=Pseudomonas sp. TaxID=306 RepID=UPI003D0B8AD6